MPSDLKSGFGWLYVLLRLWGSEIQAGDFEQFFARLRAHLITGKVGEKDLYELRRLFENGSIYIPDETFEDRREVSPICLAALYPVLRDWLTTGLDENDPRSDILAFVTAVTKQDIVINAALKMSRFADLKFPEEFEILYGNLAKQSSDSGEKRRRLAKLRDGAVEKLVTQNLESRQRLARQDSSLTPEDLAKESAKLERLYQDNLLSVTNFQPSDYILEILLRDLDFLPPHTSRFRIFYKNVLLFKDDTLRARKRIVKWIKGSEDKAFIRMALMQVYSREPNPFILDGIELFLNTQEMEHGLGEIELFIPDWSANQERYLEYRDKLKGMAKTTFEQPRNENIDREKCERFRKRIRNQGIKEIVREAADEKRLVQLVGEVLDAWIIEAISPDEAHEFQRRIGNFDLAIARLIKPPAKGISTADIVRSEKTEKEEDIQKFNLCAQEIKDALHKT